MTGFVVARIRGIEIRVNWSVLLIGTLIAWSLADSILPEIADGYSTTEYWVAGVLATIAFFAALVGHEMGHSLVAIDEGVSVEGITLWLFGGVAQLDRSPDSPRSALRIAGAGPIVSFAIGIIALTASVVLSGLVGATIAWFGLINVALAVFNLLPAFPMDGGRLYQAWLWRRTGSEHAATKKAADVGQGVGGVMVLLGLLEVLLGEAIGGFWLVMVGWFVREAARSELHHVEVERPLRSIQVSEVMSPDPVKIESDTSIAEFVAGALFRGRHAAYPVAHGNEVIGLIRLNQVQNVEPDLRATTTVADIATPIEDLVVAEPHSAVSELLSRLGQHQDRRALVFDHGDLVGIVAPSDITRLVAVMELVADGGFERAAEPDDDTQPTQGDPTCSTR